MNLNEMVMQSKSRVFNELYYALKQAYSVPTNLLEFVLHVFNTGMTLKKKS